MKIVPVIKVRDLERSVRFGTEVLNFEWRWPQEREGEFDNGLAYLGRGSEHIMLSRHAGVRVSAPLHAPDANGLRFCAPVRRGQSA